MFILTFFTNISGKIKLGTLSFLLAKHSKRILSLMRCSDFTRGGGGGGAGLRISSDGDDRKGGLRVVNVSITMEGRRKRKKSWVQRLTTLALLLCFLPL